MVTLGLGRECQCHNQLLFGVDLLCWFDRIKPSRFSFQRIIIHGFSFRFSAPSVKKSSRSHCWLISVKFSITDVLCLDWFSWNVKESSCCCEGVTPKKESSTKSSPGLFIWTAEFTD